MLLVLAAHAAEPVPRAWTVSVDPLTFALGFAHVQVERAVAPGFSVYAGPSLRLHDSLLGEPSGPFRGYGVEVGARCFPLGLAPQGAWLMARGVLAAVVARDVAPGGYGSVLAGYTWVAEPGLVLSGGLGVSWFNYGPAGVGIHGVLPAAHTAVGWAF